MSKNGWPGRVLYASGVDLSRPDGPGVNEREFVGALHARFGADLRVVTPTPVRPLSPELAELRAAFVRPPASTPWGLLAHQRQLREAIRAAIGSERPDMVILRAGLLPTGQLQAMRAFPEVPYVVKTLGEGTMAGFRGAGPVRRLADAVLGRAHDRALRELVRGARGVDACTTALVDAALRRFDLPKEQVALIENATSTSRFRPTGVAESRAALGLGHLDPIIGIVGGIPRRQGGFEMIHAVARLRERFPRLGAVIVGGGRGQGELAPLAASLGVSERCVIPGLVPYDDVPRWINAFDVGVALDDPEHLSLVGNSNQKVRQYLSCGKPVVLTPGGQLPLPKLGLGTEVKAGAFEPFLEAVTKWLALAPEARSEVGVRARAYAVAELSVETMLDARLAFWRSRVR